MRNVEAMVTKSGSRKYITDNDDNDELLLLMMMMIILMMDTR